MWSAFRLVTRNYRLICLKSTTPEELYSRKIDHEEYGEALMLAKAYGLDCDLVYQRQWRKTPVSVASIQDYLVKGVTTLRTSLVPYQWGDVYHFQ